MINIFKTFSNSFGMNNWTSVIICIITYALGLVTTNITEKHKLKLVTYQQQFNKVYLPIFRLLEPNLYNQNLSNKEVKLLIKKIKLIINKNYQLVFSSTLNIFKFWDEHSNPQKEFNNFCLDIDKNFEKLKRYLGLPKRSFYYKWNTKQYFSKIRLLIDIFFQILHNIIVSFWVISAILIFLFALLKFLVSIQ